ncbi:glycosyl hydrolase 2 galactose-binding domain-containing protein [Pontiella desulfatans]|uniref:glycosyl hydrolase 2 galactose-binding domain-containing protein n=1 Tax=Pontiella desulfatans TaxID=2750659 RepID=UPI001443D793|nr:sugar-binding domain-containing protein [Pontiella desulfatans]
MSGAIACQVGAAPGLLDRSEMKQVGRGNVVWGNASVLVDDAYLVVSEDGLHNVEFSFEGRAPENAGADQVGIWATFRQFDRNHRYVIGLRGAPHSDLYLARYAPDGNDRMLALQPVETVAPGEWAHVKVVAKDAAIKIYLNGMEKISVEDAKAPFKVGNVGIGGGYHLAEYRNIQVHKTGKPGDSEKTEPAFARDAIKINFQPGGLDAPAGWLADSGKPYSKERSYGWVGSVGTRDRKKTGDAFKDTLATIAHDQTEATFKLDLEPGEYLLTLHSGDQHQSVVNVDCSAAIKPICEKTEPGTFVVSCSQIRVDADGLVLEFSRNADGAGTSLNWLVIEPKEQVPDSRWAKGAPVVVMSAEKAALRKQQRVAYRAVKVPAIGNGRSEVSLDGDWLFLPDYEFSNVESPQNNNADDSRWHVMPVPAMWSPYAAWLFGETFPDMPYDKGASDSYYEYRHARVDALTFDWKKTKSAWYRKHIELPEIPQGKCFELCFDAIAKVSHIYVNGTFVGKNLGMFGEIKLDITRHLKAGTNVIAVRVDQEREFDEAQDDDEVIGVAISVELTRKMLSALPYGMTRQDARGIWQPTKLVITDSVRLTDLFIKPQLDGAAVDITLENKGHISETIVPSLKVISESDGSMLVQLDGKPEEVKAGESKVVTLTFTGVHPRLWSPDNPSLYTFTAGLKSENGSADSMSVVSGFKTFETRCNRFYLNGKPYALRGANHCPNMLAPNDGRLADRFLEMMRENNLNATRFHGVPGTAAWMEAADRNGILISYEGTWPWLLHAKGPIPSQESIDIWQDEFARVIKKYRNHPSLMLWTVNNEMKFHIFHRHTPTEKRTAEQYEDVLTRWKHVSNAVKMIREIDPIHPIVADSCYARNYSWTLDQSPEELGIDDGDVDDIHEYINWYHQSFFHLLDKEDPVGLPTRPYIGQEMSTGYYNGDSGHPVRAYLFAHQTPQSWVGQYAYEHQDPSIFMTRHAMLTKELAEYYRRDRREDWAGTLIFGLVTWFRNPWLADEIKPYPVVTDGLRQAMSPVLVSARLTGRNVFAGETFSIPVSIINDAENGQAVPDGTLMWSFVVDGKTMAKGAVATSEVAYYTNKQFDLKLTAPSNIPGGRADAQLRFELVANGKTVSRNHYAMCIGEKGWALEPANSSKGKILVYQPSDAARKLFQTLEVKPDAISTLNGVKLERDDCLLMVGALSDSEVEHFKSLLTAGNGRVVWMHPKAQAKELFPKHISNYRKQDGEVVTMLVAESPVFDGIQVGDLAWMGGPNVARVPVSSFGGYHVDWKNPSLTVLAEEMRAHGYLQNPSDKLKSWVTPLVQIRSDGTAPVLLSEMSAEAALTDPIALRLWANVLKGNF